eukprot:6530686-Heterocapsa_arctica.AAC.1
MAGPIMPPGMPGGPVLEFAGMKTEKRGRQKSARRVASDFQLHGPSCRGFRACSLPVMVRRAAAASAVLRLDGAPDALAPTALDVLPG